MKRLLVPAAAVAVLAVTVSASSAPGSPSVCNLLRLPPAAPAGDTVLWGHIKTLKAKGRAFELRFDPALWLSGVTAKRAAAADGTDASNDYYVVDESHRLLTYRVPANARARLLSPTLCARPVPISELAQIVKGKNPKHRPLFDRARHLGYWIRVHIDTVRTLDQQYQP